MRGQIQLKETDKGERRKMNEEMEKKRKKEKTNMKEVINKVVQFVSQPLTK
jgi:hypothetical protein